MLEMQAVTVEVPRDTILRRYMSLEIFEKLLNSSSLYFSCFTNFDDHLEGGINKNNFSSFSNSREISDLAAAALPSANGVRSQDCKSIDLTEGSFQSLFGEQKKIHGEDYLKRVSSWLYASCWTDLPHECQAMWQLYGSSGSNCKHDNFCAECQSTVGRSVCVETTLGAIMDNLEINSDYNLMVRKIDYLDHRRSVVEDHDLAIKPFFSKALHFSYENEVRFMLWPNRKNIKFSYIHGESSINTIENVSLPIKNLNSFLSRVILSPLPSSTQKKISADYRSKFGGNLGLTEALANKKLREAVEHLSKKHNLNITIDDSDLNQACATDLYDSWPSQDEIDHS